MMVDIPQRLSQVQQELTASARAVGRNPEDVCLIAVSKRHSADLVRAAAAAGVRHFGENYLQEALPKIAEVANPDLNWHFIGKLQSNKAAAVAEHFHWVHTVDRPKIAERLARTCPSGKRLNVCIQVNIDDDPLKAGIRPEQTQTLVDLCRQSGPLRLRGFMTMLHQGSEPLASYQKLAALFHTLASTAGENWDTLSMGMSADYRQAIAAGATHVRIGTAIFGERKV